MFGEGGDLWKEPNSTDYLPQIDFLNLRQQHRTRLQDICLRG